MDVAFFVSLLAHTVQAGTPLLLGTVGEIYAERSGVLNLGVEGMMAMGALTAFATSFYTGNIGLALALAMIAAALLSLVHAFLSITMRANQIVSGLAITILGLGLSGFLGKPMIGMTALHLSSFSIPILADIPVVGPILFSQDILVYTSIFAALVLWFVLFKTRLGLNVRSVGENPAMADSLGLNVYFIRYVCVVVGGATAGLAGAYLSLLYTPLWIEGMTAGKGWIVIALTIFATWNPLRAIFGAYLFGGVIALQFRLQAIGIGTEAPQFLLMLPYLTTIVALVLISLEAVRRRMGVPAALGLPYVRGE
jgi:simple sugar transport system permease protein